jgi:tetratricopeptide (TPR) repeat protein
VGDETDVDGERATAVTRADTPRRRRTSVVRAVTETGSTRLGHFQLLEPLGHGGMGTVYSAYDLRLDRKVAIKLLDASHADDISLNQRLVREAQAMAKLSHPNVVPVYEVGVDGDTVFIAMEHVTGEDLEHWLARQKPAWRAIVDVFVQAARGLAAAHEAGIVHRDFKPANVLVDDHGRVRVTDFGIALVRGSAEPTPTEPTPKPVDIAAVVGDATPIHSSTPLTEEGARVGTPAYMSPEQHRGGAVDARSDQFSFCIALFEALFHRRPFPGRGYDLSENVIYGRIDKPDPKSPVPGWVEAVVMRGLQTDAAQRFASMTELADVLARDPSRRRKRIAIGGLAATAIAASAALLGWALRPGADEACTGGEAHFAGAWDDGARAAIERSFAASHVPFADTSVHQLATVLDGYRTQWLAMHGEACRATRTRREQSEHVLDLRMACLDRRIGELRALTSLLATADASAIEHAVEAASSLTPVVGCADTTALLQAGGAIDDPAARARRAALRDRLDRLIAEHRLGRYKEVLAPVRSFVADARATADPGLLAEALDLQGLVEVKTGNVDAAVTTLTDALRRARQTNDVDRFVATTIDLVDALSEAGITQSREALGILRVAKAVVDDTHDPSLPIRMLVVEGDDLLTLAHPEDALPLLQQAVTRTRHVLGDDHALLLKVQAVLAPALSFNAKHAEARAVYESLIAGATRTLGALHPVTIGARLDLCRAITAADKRKDPTVCYKPALAAADRAMGADNRRVMIGRMYYAMTLVDLERWEPAREVLSNVVDHVPESAWNEKWYIASDGVRLLGETEVRNGDYKHGLEHCERAKLTTDKQHLGLAIDSCIGEALLGLGESTKALAQLELVKTQAENARPVETGRWRFAYARAVWATSHDVALARSLAIQARAELASSDDAWRRKQLDAWIASLPS